MRVVSLSTINYTNSNAAKRAMNACIEIQEERTVCAVQMAERRANLGNVNMRREPMELLRRIAPADWFMRHRDSGTCLAEWSRCGAGPEVPWLVCGLATRNWGHEKLNS